jgi:hypothetical protein
MKAALARLVEVLEAVLAVEERLATSRSQQPARRPIRHVEEMWKITVTKYILIARSRGLRYLKFSCAHLKFLDRHFSRPAQPISQNC